MENDRGPRRPFRRGGRPFEPLDEKVTETIQATHEHFLGSIEPFPIAGLNPFQRKQIHRHFERTPEYKVRAIRDDQGEVLLKVYPLGRLQRMAETLVQEVLMTGGSRALPPMGSFERFIIHEYIKTRGGVRTESSGEGEKRHVQLLPIFGRVPKKAKRRLTR